MTLEFVDPAANSTRRFSALLYGPEGSRKSSAAASAPAPIVYLNADRKDGITYARHILFPGKDIRETRPARLEDLHNTVFYVQEHPEVETVAIDTVGRLFDLILRNVAADEKNATFPEIGRAQTEIERFVEALLEEDVNVVLVAHDLTVETKGREADGTLLREQMPMCGTNKPGFSHKLMRHVAVVAYCGVMGEGEERRAFAQLIEADGRRAKDNTGALAGDEGFRPADLTEWADTIAAFYATGGQPASNTNDKETT